MSGDPPSSAAGRALSPGDAVVAHLREPREQLWGLLVRLDPTGLQVRGLPLDSFDDFRRWATAGAPSDEPGPAVSAVFVPMQRVEKLYRDEASAGVPSFEARFAESVGCGLGEFLRRLSAAPRPSGPIREQENER
jgi:hypothetical protein